MVQYGKTAIGETKQVVPVVNRRLGKKQTTMVKPVAVSRQVVDFQKDANGTVFGFWLLTLVIEHDQSLPGQISLRPDSLNNLRLSGEILKSLRLLFNFNENAQPHEGIPPVAWAYVVPTLYAHEVLSTVSVREALRLPRKVCRRIKGKNTPLNLAHKFPVIKAGESLYYLPVVVHHPKSIGCASVPNRSSNLARVTHDWAAKSIELGAESVRIFPMQRPLPFSIALEAADELFNA